MPGIVVPRHKRRLRRGYVWQKYYTCGVRHISKSDLALAFNNSMDELLRQREKWLDAMEGFIRHRAEELGMEVECIRTGIVEAPREGTLEEVFWEDHDDIMVWVVNALLLGPVNRQCYNPKELPMVGFYPRDIKDIINKNINMQNPNNPLNVTHISLAEAEKIEVPELATS